MSEPITSLARTLRSRAASQGGDLALKVEIAGIIGAEWEESFREVSYDELHRRAMSVAAALLERGGGGPVLIARESGLDWVASFFGCLYANRIAVPLPEPRKGKDENRWRRVVQDSGADTVLTSAGLRSHFASERGLVTIVTEELSDREVPDFSVTADEVVFLQYTSGSTGNPKGVVVTHGNLAHNLSAIQERFGHDHESRGVIWLPPYHDMGLIGGILQPVQVGFPVLLMAPGTFIRAPFRWLEAVSRFQATTSGGPSFAYQSAARRVTEAQKSELDLSAWSVAFVGAEMVRADALKEFASAFQGCGFHDRAFSPCYGLAEATLMVSASEKGRGWHVSDERILCGRPAKDTEVIIVDPESSKRKDDGEVGEIWVKGPGVARGYWRDQQFSGGEMNGKSYLRTGDLGFLIKGELALCGRLKDLIVLGGQNYLPADFEATAARAADLDVNGFVVFSVEEDGEEKVILLYETRRREQAGLREKIEGALLQQWALPLADCIAVKAPTLPRTSSGKLRRHACREAYQAGQLARISVREKKERKPSNPEEFEDFLMGHLARVLDAVPEELDRKKGFFDLGLTSLTAMSLKSTLEKGLGLELSNTLIFDYPNPEVLSQFLKRKLFPEQHEEPAKKEALSRSMEPIAIVSMACRFPGGVTTPEDFWELLREGRDAVGPVPKDRWDAAAYHHPEPKTPGKMVSTEGGFLDQVRAFDPGFFGIAPKEALTMDPQQRILLEVTAEALHRTGKKVETYAGKPVGVFIGISGQDYARHLSRRAEEEIDPYLATGNSASVAAGRLSYALGLTGPSLSVDTACSSSLVAVHLACQSLQNGECEAALVGGVNCILSPEVSIAFSQAGMLSPYGRCRTFSATADGFSRAEGCGVIVLKRLSAAQEDGDEILGTIRGSAINQDGRSGGLTIPHGPSQQAVIRQALAKAKASPEDLHYLEAHGTATELGDSVELNALAGVFSKSHTLEHPLMIGSLKTNLGHMEAAAGIGGLMKVVLAMQHRELPPHLHFDEPTPHVPWDEMPLQVNTTLTGWPQSRPALAGVSSFGFSGTNAHVILERAGKPVLPPPPLVYKRRDYWVEVEKKAPSSSLPHPWLQEILPVARSKSHHLVVSSRLFHDAVWQEHRVFDSPVFPAVGYLELFLAAIRSVGGPATVSLRDLSLAQALPLSESAPLQVVLSEGEAEVVRQDHSGEWQTLCVTKYEETTNKVSVWPDLENPKNCDPSSVYERLARQGVTYGKSWQRIESLRLGDDGQVEASLRALSDEQGFHFHPLVLDAFVQTIAAVFLNDDEVLTYLPEGIGQAIFHRDSFTGDRLRVRGRVRSGEGWVSADLVLLDDRLEPLVTLKDFRLRPFSPVRAVDSVEDWFYQITWRSEELAKPPAEGLSPDALARALKQDCDDALRESEIEAYRKGLPQLERFALARVRDLLPEVDESTVISEQQQLWSHLKSCLENQSISESPTVSGFSAELKLLERCLGELPSVLRGNQNPLEVLFPKGDASELTWFYEQSVAARLLNVQVVALITQIKESLGRPIRILEVGAGTGGTTSAVIPALSEVDEYLFTDVSPLLVEGARERFADVPQMNFKVLDLEKESPDLEGFDLILAANVIHATRDLEESLGQVHRMLVPRGYLVLLEGVQPLLWLDLIFGLTKGWWGFNDAWRRDYPLLSECRWHELFSSQGWESATVTTGQLPQAVFAARKLVSASEDLVFSAINLPGGLEEGTKGLLEAVQKTEKKNLTVLTQGATTDPAQAAIWGLARAIELEYPSFCLRRIDLDPAIPMEEQMAKVKRELVSESTGAIRFRNGKREIARLEKLRKVPQLEKPEGENRELTLSQDDKRELTIVSTDRQKPAFGEVEIRVEAAGLNFIDGLDIAGMLPFERGWLGVECSGKVVRIGGGVSQFKVGDCVMALAPRSFREFVTTPAFMVNRWPEGVTTAAEAATFPVNFLTAQRALQEAARLQRGETILIHAGAGGTGMAAIQLARQAGATVFASASRSKWDALRDLGVTHCFDSRTLDFADEIMAITRGQGIEVVLNSLSDNYIEKGLSILSKNGRFIELGKRGIWTEKEVAALRPDVNYHVIDLFAESETRLHDWQTDERDGRLFEKFPAKVVALPHTVFPVQEAARAVSYLQRARHIGKVVLNFCENPYSFNPDASYLITGGAGGLGLETARWMIAQGARNIWLVSRRLPDPQDDKFTPLREAMAQGWITFASADVSQREELAQVIAQAGERAPLRGVIHAAGVLKDGLIKDLSWDAMQEVLQPKAMGGWHLHELTRDLPLDFFLLYSSAASLLGSPGQGSHVAANAFLDALAHHRRALGLPAQSLNWGGWSEVGSAASASTERELAKRGVTMMTPSQGIDALALALQRPDLAQLGIIPADWQALARLGLSSDPFFAEVIQVADQVENSPSKAALIAKGEWREELNDLPLGQQKNYLIRKLREELAQVIGLPAGDLPPTAIGFFDLGVDSLMSVDLKNRLTRALGLEISPTLLFQHPTINALAEQLVEKLKPTAPKTSEPTPEKAELRESTIAAELAALEDLLG